MTGELLRPLHVGRVRLPNNLILSPMAGFSDLPFRVLCRRHGAGLVSSEMVGAVALDRIGPENLQRMKTLEAEKPNSIQVFGTDPDAVARATRIVARDCDVVGFNMGCPAFQIQRQGCGAALLDHPERAEEIVTAMRAATSKPLLVKIRAGNRDRMDVIQFTRRLEAAGADAIILHGRTAAQAYSGESDWRLIRDVKQALAVPLIGNGDVTDGPTAKRALDESGCDGIALGRATLGDPRVFQRIAHYLETGEKLPPPTLAEKVEDFIQYAETAKAVGLDGGHVMRQGIKFTRGIPGAAPFRERLKGSADPLVIAAWFREFARDRGVHVHGSADAAAAPG